MNGACRLPIFDARPLGAIVAVLITLAEMSIPQPETDVVRSRTARGELGVQVTSFVLSPASGQIASTNTSGRAALRTEESGWRIERFFDFPGYAKAVAFSPDGRLLAAGGFAPGICLWELNSGQSVPSQTVAVSIQRATRIMFSPDGQCLAVTSDLDGKILLWDLVTRRERMVFHHSSPVVSVAFSPDGRWLATAGVNADRSILLWDLHTGCRQTLLEHGPGPAMAIAFSPDGALLATANAHEHLVSLWDLETQRVCRVLAGHERSVNSIAFTPDGALVATAGNDGMLGLWTVTTGRRRMSLDTGATRVLAVTFSPDGRTLVLATGYDDDLRMYDLAEVLRVEKGHDKSWQQPPLITLSSQVDS